MATFTAVNGTPPNDQPAESTERRAPEDPSRASVAIPPEASQSPPRDVKESAPLPTDKSQERRDSNPQIKQQEAAESESHKRKRSVSLEARHNSPPPQHHIDVSPGRAPSQDAEDLDSLDEDDMDSEESGSHTHQRSYSHDERSAYELHGADPNRRGPTDEQIGDTLRRATEHGDQHDFDGHHTNSDAQLRAGRVQISPSTYYSDRRPPMLQHDPKKRKRNFSNRTKTGCLTCRKRKKKCDEQKPECSNCIRGGFLCAGYPPMRGAWSKPDIKLPAVPLESKDPSYVPPGAYGMPSSASYPQPSKREPLPHYRGQVLRIDPPQGRPLADDDRATASTTMASTSARSPENKFSGTPYTPGNMFPTPVSANTTQPPPSFGERMSKDYHHRVPPLHDLTRGAADPDTPHPGGNTQPLIIFTRNNSLEYS